MISRRAGALLFAVSLPCLLHAAADDGVARLPVTPLVDASIHFTIIDSRQGAEESGGYISTKKEDCERWTYRISDVQTDPPRLSVLHTELIAALGTALHDKSLDVTRYAIFINKRSYFEFRSAIGEYGSARGVVPSMGSRCESQVTRGGYYAPWESTTNYSPIIVELNASYDGKPLRVRVVHSPGAELSMEKFGRGEHSEALLAAMRIAMAELIMAIRKTAGATQ